MEQEKHDDKNVARHAAAYERFGTVIGWEITNAKENCELRRRVAYVAKISPSMGI